jgi:hypothetical protein
MSKLTGAAAALLFLLPLAASAQQTACKEAQDEHERVLDQLSEKMRRYARCVGDSAGNNDCALDFKQLDKAQKRFENSIMAIGFTCRSDRRAKSSDPE